MAVVVCAEMSWLLGRVKLVLDWVGVDGFGEAARKVVGVRTGDVDRDEVGVDAVGVMIVDVVADEAVEVGGVIVGEVEVVSDIVADGKRLQITKLFDKL